MKHFACLVFLASLARAQIQVINPTDNGATSLTKINSNFSFLNSSKTTTVFGSGAPGSVPGTARGSWYLDVTNLVSYQCFRTPSCTAVAAGNWQLEGAAGVGTVTSVSFTGGIVSVANPTTTPAFTVAGTSGGFPCFTGSATWASSSAMTQYGVVYGGGAGVCPGSTAADSTTTHALFATAGAPAFRAVAAGDIPTLNQNTTGSAGSFTGSLVGDVTGTQGATVVGKINGTSLAGLATGILKNTTSTGVPSIAVASDVVGLFSGGHSSSSYYLATDGSQQLANGAGTVTSVSFTGGIVSVASPTSTPAFTVAGTSGGIPCFNGASTWTSSGALPSGDFVLGGGAGACTTASFATVPVSKGGTGTGSTLTGLVRGGSPLTAAELSGDVTTSGSNAATAIGLNGTLLSGLATGLLKNTTGTGIPSIATYSDIVALWSTCSGATPLLSYTGSCAASGGGGVSFGVFVTAITNPGTNTIYTIGSDCSASVPCNVQVGDGATANVCHITSAGAVTITAGADTWRFYIDQSCNIDAGTPGSGTATCSGCTVTSLGSAAFPAGSAPLYTATSASAAWVPSGLTDYRGFLGNKPNTIASTGLLASGNTLSVDTTVVAAVNGATVTNMTCSSGCSGFSSTNTIDYSLLPNCNSTGQIFSVWSTQSSNAVGFYCPNSSDAYQGALIQYSAANTNVASVNVPVPTGWVSGTVTLTLQVYGASGGAGNIAFQAQTYCSGAGTAFGSGQTYNAANNTNVATSPTAVTRAVLTANLTMTGCAADNILTVLIAQRAANTWTTPVDIAGGLVTFNLP